MATPKNLGKCVFLLNGEIGEVRNAKLEIKEDGRWRDLFPDAKPWSLDGGSFSFHAEIMDVDEEQIRRLYCYLYAVALGLEYPWIFRN